MANRYGEAALMAADSRFAPRMSPPERWRAAMEKLYPTSIAAREKNCPRGAFLGLCEAGMVVGVRPGDYSASRVNKDYAVRAAKLLMANQRHWSISELWRAACNGEERKHNGQMDVVLALWKNHCLQEPPRD